MKEMEHRVSIPFDAEEWKFIHQIRNVLYEGGLEKMTISEFLKEACIKTLVESATSVQNAVREHPGILDEPNKIQVIN